MADNESQLIFELHKGQGQFAYFQLGVAASAIAFAIHETSGMSLNNAPWPLGLAVALWAVSFALGCFGLDARQGGIYSNAWFLQVKKGIPAQFATPNIVQMFEEMKKDVKKDLGKPYTHFRWQKWTLFSGALAFIAGHLMQMAAIPAATDASPNVPPISAAQIDAGKAAAVGN